MKRTGILNSQLAGIIAAMGHTDLLVIADAGLPMPPGVTTIDLAVVAGVPPFFTLFDAIAAELAVESLTVAEEAAARDAAWVDAVRARFPAATLDQISHEAFKRRTARARAVVRTGECTPYANVILQAGVTF